MPTRVLIVDNYPIFIKGIVESLKEHDDIVTEAICGNYSVSEQVEIPDVIILIGRNLTTYTRLRLDLQERNPRVGILTMIDASHISRIRHRIGERDSGFLLQSTGSASLIAAVRGVLNDRHYVDPDILSIIYGCNRIVLPTLTKRETEVLKLICEGYTAQGIADKLFLSLRTVENHRCKLLNKMGVSNTARLVRMAVETGMV